MSVGLLLNDGSGLGYSMSVDYDLLMEYNVSFTADMCVISISLYPWIMSYLWNLNVSFTVDMCVIFILW